MSRVDASRRLTSDELGSRAMKADAKQTDFCVYLSAILVTGLVLNAALGWWWADPLAGFGIVYVAGREKMQVVDHPVVTAHE